MEPVLPAGDFTARSFLALAESAEDVVVRLDPELRALYVNHACERVLERSRHALLGRTPDEAGAPDSILVPMRTAAARVFAGEPLVTLRLEYAAPGRAVRSFDVRVVPEHDAAGRVTAVVLIGRDVTDQVHVAAALQESEVRFQAVFESVPVGMAVSTREAHGYATNANRALARMLGYTRAELAQMHFSEFTHPDDVELDMRLLEEVRLGQRDSYAVEKRLIRKDGSSIWADLSVFAVRDAAGALRFVVGLTEDISERKEIESELRASEERFRALVENTSDLIAILEPEGEVRYASPSQTRVLGYSDEEIRAMNALALVHPDDVDLVRERIGEAMRTAGSLPPERPIRFRRRDGAWRSLMPMVTDMRDNPAVRGLVVNARDVTEELRLQEHLTQAQKMEALGQLAGGVAHDFNNILAAISGYAELLLLDLPSGSQAAEDAAEIAKATTRGAGVTKQLLAFSRRQTLETEVLDLAEVVRETGGMLRALLPATIDLALPAAGGAPVPVRAARAQIEQIILNLAVNARDAMPHGGKLRLALTARRTGQGGEGVLEVADSGTGMSEEVRARAFEPFFTTKAKGHGTGLGLATVYGLVRQFGGEVQVESAPGRGTTFTVSFPLADPGHAAPLVVPAEFEGRAGARLLVAEDERPLRTLISRALERADYDVTAAADGAAALAAIHGGEPFDLLISDVAMPRMGGRELASAVEAGWPDLPVVLMSGYAELESTPDAVASLPGNVAAFVEKPFEVDRLLHIVADVLARQPSGER